MTFNSIWRPYFDIDRDYTDIIKNISHNDTLKTAASYGYGIRILRQDPWEALCSFIISQNNNIPRIKGIVERLCVNFGSAIPGGFSFPTAEVIASLTLDDLQVLRSGFRAKYLLDAAKKVANGEEYLFDSVNGDIYAIPQENKNYKWPTAIRMDWVEKLGYDPEADLENPPDSVFCAHGAGFTVKWHQVKEYMHLESGLKEKKER